MHGGGDGDLQGCATAADESGPLPAGVAGAGRIAAYGIKGACATALDTSRNPAIICTWNHGVTWSRVI